MKDLKEYQASEKVIENKPQDKIEAEQVQSLMRNLKSKDSDMLLIGEDMQKIDYKLSQLL